MKSGPLRKPKYQPGEVHHNNNLKIIIYKGQFPKPKYQGSPLAGDVSTCPSPNPPFPDRNPLFPHENPPFPGQNPPFPREPLAPRERTQTVISWSQYVSRTKSEAPRVTRVWCDLYKKALASRLVRLRDFKILFRDFKRLSVSCLVVPCPPSAAQTPGWAGWAVEFCRFPLK